MYAPFSYAPVQPLLERCRLRGVVFGVSSSRDADAAWRRPRPTGLPARPRGQRGPGPAAGTRQGRGAAAPATSPRASWAPGPSPLSGPLSPSLGVRASPPRPCGPGPSSSSSPPGSPPASVPGHLPRSGCVAEGCTRRSFIFISWEKKIQRQHTARLRPPRLRRALNQQLGARRPALRPRVTRWPTQPACGPAALFRRRRPSPAGLCEGRASLARRGRPDEESQGRARRHAPARPGGPGGGWPAPAATTAAADGPPAARRGSLPSSLPFPTGRSVGRRRTQRTPPPGR